MTKPKKPKYDSENFIIQPAEAEVLRTAYLLGPMREFVRRFMNDFPLVQTVLIQVAQYYDDEASDAVHFRMYPSVLAEWWQPPPAKPWTDKKGRVHPPAKVDYYHEYEEFGILPKNLPFVDQPKRNEDGRYEASSCRSVYDLVSRWEERSFGWGHWLRKAGWSANGAMIPLFAAFCVENGYSDEYVPLCKYSRTKDGALTLDDVSMEFVGDMRRPDMNGVRPEDESAESGEDETDESTKLSRAESDVAFFDWVRKSIAKCEETKNDPLAEMREHIKRRDLVLRDEERNVPPGLIFWTMRGPVVREKEAERLSGMDNALREVHEEWERRKQWDADFTKKYDKSPK